MTDKARVASLRKQIEKLDRDIDWAYDMGGGQRLEQLIRTRERLQAERDRYEEATDEVEGQ